MNARIIGKLVGMICVCIFLVAILHVEHTKKMNAGRDAFIAAETARYDRDYSKPRPVGIEVIGCALITALLFGSYELIAFGVTKVVEKTTRDETAPGRSGF